MSKETTKRFCFLKRPQLSYMMLAGWCCLGLFLDHLHNNNTEFVWDGVGWWVPTNYKVTPNSC